MLPNFLGTTFLILYSLTLTLRIAQIPCKYYQDHNHPDDKAWKVPVYLRGKDGGRDIMELPIGMSAVDEGSDKSAYLLRLEAKTQFARFHWTSGDILELAMDRPTARCITYRDLFRLQLALKAFGEQLIPLFGTPEGKQRPSFLYCYGTVLGIAAYHHRHSVRKCERMKLIRRSRVGRYMWIACQENVDERSGQASY
ncbi:hypothetical protein PZA11_000549 [Diplocarpon coronariae]